MANYFTGLWPEMKDRLRYFVFFPCARFVWRVSENIEGFGDWIEDLACATEPQPLRWHLSRAGRAKKGELRWRG